MPRSSTGKWVQRAAATGGGRTYRGQRPVNWYASLVVIAVIGLVSIIWARYEYQNPSSATSTKVQPTVGTTWHAAIGMNICGTATPAIPASASDSKAGMTTTGNGVLVIAPKTSAQAGHNATFSQFIDGTPGLTLTSSEVAYPHEKVLRNGDKCPSGTPDAGKAGTVQVAYWSSYSNGLKDYQLVSDPASLRPVNLSEITMNFLPKGAKINKPPGSAILAMVQAASASSTPTTSPTTATTTPTTSATTPTTVPPTTPTTAGPSASSTTSTTSKR